MRLFVCTLCLLLAHLSWAQTGGSIQGRVTDPKSKEPLTGVVVFLDGTKYSAVTDLDGKFSITQLPQGTYKLLTSLLGYKSHNSTVVITDERGQTLDIALSESNTTLSEVVVMGRMDMESDVAAARMEQRADQVVHVVSARTIQVSPDISVAEVSQRVSGVSIERSSQGDARFAIIRGMEPRYNNTLVNGVKIPSPDAKSRYVPLDVFPAEMLLRMEVSKTLTPEMEGDAIGGTINMVMKPAPDSLYLSGTLASGYNQFFVNKDYTRWSRGAMGSDPSNQFPGSIPPPQSFQYDMLRYNRSAAPPNSMLTATAGRRFFTNRLGVLVSGAYQNAFRGTESELFTVSVDPRTRNTLYTGVQIRNYFSQLQRSGLNAVLDYKIHKNHMFTFTNIYMDLREFQTRTIIDTSFVSNRSTPGTGRIDLFERSRFQIQTIRSHNLQGEHKLTRSLLVDWSAVYADARQRIPDLTEYNRSYVITEAPGSPDSARFDNIVKEWQSNNDEDYAAYLNVTYKTTLLGMRMEWKAGGLYRDKIRNNRFNNYKFLFDGVSPYSQGIQDVSLSQLQVVYNPANAFFNNENFRATENVTAYFLQTRFLIGDVQVLTGFRTEITTQQFRTNARRTFNTPSEASVQYTDFLPSLHLKYMLDDYTNIRFSAFKSLSRPSYFELVPYRIVGENFIEQGNFNLKRTEADNFDLKYEWFPGRDRHFSGGIFYKSIRNPVEYGFTDASGSTIAPQNFGTATNYGFELVAMQFWGSWGVSANYTFTNSSLTMRKIRNTDTLTFEVNESRPLQGQSAHIANASLLYKNEKIGLNVQLAYVLTGRRVVQISPLEGKDFIQQDLHLLDLSLEKLIHRYLLIFGKFTNLINTPYRETVADGTLVRTDFYAQNYMIGLRYRL